MDKLTLVTGSEGLVGSRFTEISEHRTKFHSPKFAEFDITNRQELKAILTSFDLGAIVNFAAYTNVGEAEKERGNKKGDVWKINVEAPQKLAEAVALTNHNVQLIHISTDMVFSGGTWDPGPYKEEHKPDVKSENLTWYGYTKAEGERMVKKILGEDSTIVRIIYPVRADFPDKLDYIRKPLRLFDENKIYPLFSNQQISISFIDEIVQALDKIINLGARGVFHVASKDTTTPYELIKYTLEKTGRDNSVLKSIKLEEFLKSTNSPKFRYPKFGGLSVASTEKALEMSFRSWKEIVGELVEQGLGRTN